MVRFRSNNTLPGSCWCSGPRIGKIWTTVLYRWTDGEFWTCWSVAAVHTLTWQSWYSNIFLSRYNLESGRGRKARQKAVKRWRRWSTACRLYFWLQKCLQLNRTHWVNVKLRVLNILDLHDYEPDIHVLECGCIKVADLNSCLHIAVIALDDLVIVVLPRGWTQRGPLRGSSRETCITALLSHPYTPASYTYPGEDVPSFTVWDVSGYERKYDFFSNMKRAAWMVMMSRL